MEHPLASPLASPRIMDLDAASIAPSIATVDVPLAIPVGPLVSPLAPPATRPSPEQELAPVLPSQQSGNFELGLRVRRTRDISNASLPPPYEIIQGANGSTQRVNSGGVQSPTSPNSAGSGPKSKSTRCCGSISSQAKDALHLLSQFIVILLSCCIVILLAIGTPPTPVLSPDANSADLVSFNISGVTPNGTTLDLASENELRVMLADSYDMFRPWVDKVGNNSRVKVDIGIRLNVTLRSISSIPWTVEWARLVARFPDNKTIAGISNFPGFTLNSTSSPRNTLSLVMNINRTLVKFSDVANDTVLTPLFATCGLLSARTPQFPDTPRRLTFRLELEMSILALRMWSWTRATQSTLVANRTVTWNCNNDQFEAKVANVTGS